MQLNPTTVALKLLIIGTLSLQLTACGGEGSTASNTSPSEGSNGNPPSSENQPNNKSDEIVNPELKAKIYIHGSYKPLLVTSKNGDIIPFSNLKITDGDVEDVIMLSDKAVGIKLPISAQGEQSIEFTDTSDSSVKRYEFEVTDPQQTIDNASGSSQLLSHGFNKADSFLYTQPVIAHNNTLKNFDNSVTVSFTPTDHNYCQGLTESSGKLILELPNKDSIKVISEQAKQSKIDAFNQYNFLYKNSYDQVKVYSPDSNTEISPNADNTYYVSCVANMPADTDYKALAAELTNIFSAQNTDKIIPIIKQKYMDSGKNEQQATEIANKNAGKYSNWYKAKLTEQLANKLPLSQPDNISPQLLARQISQQLLTKSIIVKLNFQILAEELKDSLGTLKDIEEIEKQLEEPVRRASQTSAAIASRARSDWFSAEAMFIKYESIYHRDIELITSKNYPPVLVKPSLDFINRRYNEAKYIIENGRKGFGITRISNNLYATYQYTKRDCTTKPNRQNWHCELLQPINDQNLDRIAMKKWSLNELRELYKQIQRVRGNLQ